MNKANLLAMIAIALLGVYGCESDGPVEEAGESIDNAIDGMADSADNVGDSLSEAAEDACDNIGDATNSDVDC